MCASGNRCADVFACKRSSLIMGACAQQCVQAVIADNVCSCVSLPSTEIQNTFSLVDMMLLNALQILVAVAIPSIHKLVAIPAIHKWHEAISTKQTRASRVGATSDPRELEIRVHDTYAQPVGSRANQIACIHLHLGRSPATSLQTNYEGRTQMQGA